jgi:hypothetical protein
MAQLTFCRMAVIIGITIISLTWRLNRIYLMRHHPAENNPAFVNAVVKTRGLKALRMDLHGSII